MTHDRLGRPLVGPCLIWTGPPTKDGYARITNKDFGTFAPQLAHRAAWAMAHGVPLDQLTKVPELDHLCRVHACSSAAHLEPVTRKENLARGDGNQNVGKGVCDHGHEFTEANTYRRRGGGRDCWTCKRTRARESWRRLHAVELVGQPPLSRSESAARAGRGGRPVKR